MAHRLIKGTLKNTLEMQIVKVHFHSLKQNQPLNKRKNLFFRVLANRS